MSIVFDRAVSYYDRTRAMPPEIADRPIETLIRETQPQPGARVLELGIGAGRIAVPLVARIGRLFGVDLSLAMMDKVRGKLAESRAAIDLAQADILHLPFPDDLFDVEYAVGVMHLVEGWEKAIAEARRTCKHGGYLLVAWEREPSDSPVILALNQVWRLVAPFGFSRRMPGAQSEQEILRELAKWGNRPREVEIATSLSSLTPAQVVHGIEHQIRSELWSIPAGVIQSILPDFRMWAENCLGPLDQPISSSTQLVWLIAQK